MLKIRRHLLIMKRDFINWSSGNVVDTSAIKIPKKEKQKKKCKHLTNKQKYDIGKENEKIQN